MTDSEGTPDGPDRPDHGDRGPDGRPTGAGRPGSPATGAGAARRRQRRRRGMALGAAALVLGTGVSGWAAYQKLNGNITADTAAEAELKRYERERPTALVRGAQNILLIGSDSRAGPNNRKYGHSNGTARSDTTILLHLAAHRRWATAVSIPRDLMVSMPACRRPDGRTTGPAFAMFNHAYEAGGTACTIRTVEKLTNIRIDHHVVIDFQGFKNMVNAVHGVRICLREPIRDSDAHLMLRAGPQTLGGEQALGYVRARKSLGNGSDTDRMDRQQRFLGALAAKVQSNGVLLNPGRLYPLLDAATSSLTTDPGLASLRGLYNLVRGVRKIPTGNIQFLTVPIRPYPGNANRDQLVAGAAGKLFRRLRTDTPVGVARAPRTPGHATPGSRSPAASPPTFRGNTASEDGCG
ncbi:LCP family protein [Streptomyces odontomachi]|uniref:LCP family protein n=1 Tax=Streptomyces odontomachi TaxID=2944940 RepID=UPI00210CB98B|nr:LCP family protein [Streptomyces sp. ODS25]